MSILYMICLPLMLPKSRFILPLPHPPGNHKSVPCVCESVLFCREVPLRRVLDSKALLNMTYHSLAMMLIMYLLLEPEPFPFAL